MEKNNTVEIRAEDLCRRCEKQYAPQITQFLTLEEQASVLKISKRFPDVLTVFEGGWKSAERKTALFLPADLYEYPKTDAEADYIRELSEIEFVKIEGSGFVKIGHRDVLGALMSLGIKRETLGDIVVSDGSKTAYAAAFSSAARFICSNLERVARDKVKVSLVSHSAVPEKVQKFSDLSLTLASLRIDALVSDVLNISRDKAKKLISSGAVSVNHSECTDAGNTFEAGDIVSVKGEGKFAVDSFLGLTAKNRHRVIVRKYL